MDQAALKHFQQFMNCWMYSAFTFSKILASSAQNQNQKPEPAPPGPAKEIEPKEFPCFSCDKKYSTYKGLKQHMGKSHNSTVKNFLCDSCGGLFSNKYALKFHRRQVHEKSTTAKCSICEKTFYNKYKLKKHILRTSHSA
ncbi:unnamed protein product [Blepharisma stoltei]|uniref:C2H2-type domain-containing protein n=1 Tax=Blepharisma stoltei TaxID=1481888 RepID=A0AAU9J0Z8_9CILI|nr:unnamed protein product [Blepharisma stoltei]